MTKIKTSSILFAVGIFLLLILVFMFAVPQSTFDANIGGDEGITLSAKDISEPTVIILFSISVLAILIGFIFKLKFEDNKKR